MPTRLRFFLAAVVLAAAAFGIWRLRPQDWPKYRRLAEHGALIQGTVTAKSADGTVYYSFSADDRMYSGMGTAGYGNPELDNLGEGDSVVLAYLPSDPDVSVLGAPRERLRDQNRAIAVALLAAVPILLLSLVKELDRFE